MRETINEKFEEQAARTPENIAIRCKGESMTYGALNALANRYAHFLKEQGVVPETLVGVVMRHSPEMIAWMLAVLKAGGGYVPAEPSFPKYRIQSMMEQARARLVVTEKEWESIFDGKFPLALAQDDYERYAAANPEPVNDASNIIYVLFTSGTTGVPKGVVVEQGNVCNYARAFQKEFAPSERDRMLQYSVCTFDIFVDEVFPVLLCGGRLVIAREEELTNIDWLRRLLREEQVTMLSAFPYLLQSLNDGETPDSLRLAISGGDILRGEYVTNLLPRMRIYNTYGPTETTVCASYYHYTGEEDGEAIPVGKAIEGVEILLLDESLQAVPMGRMGEICIAGAGVTRGYLNNEEQTARAFIANPRDPKQRLYRSGDLGMRREDGNIVFIERKDDQVMIGGKRVEPLEVEQILYKNSQIRSAFVCPHRDAKGYHYLTAYLVAKKEIDLHALEAMMREYLPFYMMPAYYVQMESLPRMASGKVDKAKLPVVLR